MLDAFPPDDEKYATAFDVDERVYSVTALLRVGYWFTDRTYVFVSKPSEYCLRVHLKVKPASLDSPVRTSAADLAGEFANSLLDYQLRETIEQRTGSIREFLVTKALTEAALVQDAPPGTGLDSVGLVNVSSSNTESRQ